MPYPDYDRMKTEYPRLKGRLTRATKRGPQAVVDEVHYAYTVFDDIGWPDGWSRWQRARDDALNELRAAAIRAL